MGGGRRGFTLVEVMVVVGILAVVLAVGIPSFMHHRAERDLEGAQRQLESIFDYARQTAKNQGASSTSSVGCTVTLTSGNPFTCVVTDASGNQVQNYTSPTTVILSSPTLIYQYNTNGTMVAGGQITLTSTSTSTVDTVTLYQTTGGVSIP